MRFHSRHEKKYRNAKHQGLEMNEMVQCEAIFSFSFSAVAKMSEKNAARRNEISTGPHLANGVRNGDDSVSNNFNVVELSCKLIENWF